MLHNNLLRAEIILNELFSSLFADMISNKKLNAIISEWFIGKKIIYLVFITQLYFKAPKDVRLKTTHYL